MPDLPRRRPPSSSWTQPLRDRLSPLIRALIIAELAMFAFYKVVPPLRSFLVEHVALGPGALSGEVWQFFTALFVHMDGWSLFFNVIGLWFVGAFTERIHGTRRFLVLLVGAGVLANLAIAVVARFSLQMQVFSGASYAILALFVAYGRTYGRAETQVLGSFFLQARLLALILVGWSLVASISQSPPDWAGVAGCLAASAFGYVWAGGGPGEILDALRALWARRQRRRYRVLDGGQAPPAKRSKPYMN